MAKIKDAQFWIKHLDLTSHPEGGYYKRVYLAQESVRGENLPARFGGGRAFSSAIYFLLEGGDFSALHRIKSDEVWHHYYGSSLHIYCIDSAGALEVKKLGTDLEGGEAPQRVVLGGSWFGGKLSDPQGFGLFGCTVAPAFDFNDFEFGKRAELLQSFPEHKSTIEMLTR